jgi:hypothetical protein
MFKLVESLNDETRRLNEATSALESAKTTIKSAEADIDSIRNALAKGHSVLTPVKEVIFWDDNRVEVFRASNNEKLYSRPINDDDPQMQMTDTTDPVDDDSNHDIEAEQELAEKEMAD